MNRINVMKLLSGIILGFAIFGGVATDVQARHHVSFGVAIGGPYFSSGYYYYPDYYYPYDDYGYYYYPDYYGPYVVYHHRHHRHHVYATPYIVIGHHHHHHHWRY